MKSCCEYHNMQCGCRQGRDCPERTKFQWAKVVGKVWSYLAGAGWLVAFLVAFAVAAHRGVA